MEKLEMFITMIDYLVNTRRKRHIVGGIFISSSLLFGGLALTTITIKEKENE